MTKEERENALHCLRVMIDEEVCEECNLYGTTGTDHCEADCVRAVIEALEQEPCNDCISREAAIKALEENKYSSAFCVEHHIDWSINIGMAHIALNELPPVQPKQEWIPVTERLPERSGKYVVLYESRLDNKTHLGMDYYFVSDVRNELNGWIHLNVIKWLPIPEYKENK